MQLTDKDGNIFGTGGLEITTSSGKPKVPVINTDITIGTTAIIGGVVGRILFEGTGNVVQESSSFTYDDTLKKFTLTGPIGSVIQHTALTNYNDFGGFQLNVAGGAERAFMKLQPNSGEFKLGVTGSGYFTTFHTSGLERARIFQNGNFAVNTTTDSGFKFDVAGTIRSQSSLFISNPSFTSGGSITHSANATLVITGGPGGGTENITFGPTNRIFINATQSRFPNGSVQIASTLSVGVANATSQNMIWATGGITASSAIARGIYTDTTLTASANNDFLVGLDVQPTFTNGAFTGVTNLALRTTGQVRLNANGEISSFQGYGSDIFRVHSNANGLLEIGQNLVTPIGVSAKATIYNRNNTYFAISINVPASQLGKGAQIAWNNQGQGGGTIYHSNEVLYDMGMVNANSHYLHMFTSGNVLLTNGTRTDAGFKLDVNGSARVQSGLTVSGSLNLNSSDISSAWTTYTPTWSTDGATQPSLGNGTITGAYKVIGKTVFVRVRLVFGTTTTAGTGTFYFSLPVNAAAAWGVQMPASILDNGNAWYQATVNGEYGGFTDKVALITQSAGGANSSQGVTGVFPITFASTDSIQFNGSYESV